MDTWTIHKVVVVLVEDIDTDDGDRNDRARPEPNGHDSFGTGPTVHDGQSVKECV